MANKLFDIDSEKSSKYWHLINSILFFFFFFFPFTDIHSITLKAETKIPTHTNFTNLSPTYIIVKAAAAAAMSLKQNNGQNCCHSQTNHSHQPRLLKASGKLGTKPKRKMNHVTPDFESMTFISTGTFRIVVTINSQVSSRWRTWYQADMSSVYLWIALILPATASPAPKHAWTASSFWPWTSQFVLVYRGCLWLTGWFIFCSNVSGLESRAWTVIACTQRNSRRREWAASYWTKYIWRNWSHTVLTDLWCTSWSLIFGIAGMKNAWAAYAKRQMKLFFFCGSTWQFYERYNTVSAKWTRNRAQWANHFRMDIAGRTKIECTSHTKLMPTSYIKTSSKITPTTKI